MCFWHYIEMVISGKTIIGFLANCFFFLTSAPLQVYRKVSTNSLVFIAKTTNKVGIGTSLSGDTEFLIK